MLYPSESKIDDPYGTLILGITAIQTEFMQTVALKTSDIAFRTIRGLHDLEDWQLVFHLLCTYFSATKDNYLLHTVPLISMKEDTHHYKDASSGTPRNVIEAVRDPRTALDLEISLKVTDDQFSHRGVGFSIRHWWKRRYT